eukprot:scaffold13844_cov55-Attheya_sp.AAC.5
MRKKQDIFDGQCNDPNIKLLESGKFTYPSFNQDKKVVLECIENGRDCQRVLEDMQMRQKIHDGDRSNETLLTLERKKWFSYDGWESDVEAAKNALLLNKLNLITSAESRAQHILQGLDIKQKMHLRHDVLYEVMNSGLFTYDSFEADKKRAIQ